MVLLLLLWKRPRFDHRSKKTVVALGKTKAMHKFLVLHYFAGQGVPAVDTQLQKAALVILWMAMRLEDFPYMCEKPFAEAAGLEGKARWGLVLSSSARVTQMIYQTVIGVRYPELVEVHGDCTFGRFVPPDVQLRGGFLSVFWDVPRARLADIGAVVDWLCDRHTFSKNAKSSLAVLHNQNEMVNHFKASSWVSEAKAL